MTELNSVEPSVRGLPEPEAGPRVIRIPTGPSWFERNEAWIIAVASIVAFLAIWEIVADLRIWPVLFLPGPSDIIVAFAGLFRSSDFAEDIWVSTEEIVLGYGLSVLVGLPVGVAMGWYRRLGYAFDPFVTFFYTMPRIALIPLLIIWFGIGIGSKIAIVFLGAVFPIIINTATGIRNLDPSLIKAARSFGARDLQLFRTVALPGSLPFILAGLRLGVGHALTGVVVGELIGAEAGIGLMMANAGATFQTARVFAGIIIIAGAGMIITLVLQKIETHFQAWRPERR